ncbi:uncharacterized protein LOC130644834 isoform X2 [Hydractinia symbiolongicarpus]|uniref:uncharacterized protein LOC130644834 isoform X2 n=1 Tax=Hydractinia symbiolongicarpus TaxID=13093 RepID=UPI00254F8C3E|nr:uncharacterized protein LOC130644834 isoform X2 [Hydractinia symbiolongicarpus]
MAVFAYGTMGVCFIVRFLLVLLHLPTIHTPFTRAIENECGSNQTKTDDGGCICNAGFYRNPANSQCTEECCYCTPANNQVVKEWEMQKLGRDCGSQETGGKCISNTTQESKSKKTTTTSKPTLETTGLTVSKQSDSNKGWPINIGIGICICIIVIISIIGIYKYCKEKKKKDNQAQISSVSFTNNGSSTNDLVQITVLSDAGQANGKSTYTRKRSPQSQHQKGAKTWKCGPYNNNAESCLKENDLPPQFTSYGDWPSTISS